MTVASFIDAKAGVRPVNLLIWIAIAASALMFRFEASHLSGDDPWYWRIWYISVLQWLLWQELIAYAMRAPALEAPPLLSGAFLLFFAAAAILLRPEFVNVFLLVAGSGLLLFRFRDDACRRIGLCLVLVVVAHFAGSSLVAPLHALWTRIDASLLSVALTLLGEAPLREGSIVYLPRIERALAVEYVCSTTWVLTLPLFVFVQVTVLRHGGVNRRDVQMIAAIFVVTLALNIARMVLMSPSQASYEYWHFGTGADFFSLATAIMVFVGLRPVEKVGDPHALAA